MALVNANNYIDHIELVETNANFIPEGDWFGNDTSIVNLNQPMERYRIYFKDLTNFGSKTLCFGELLEFGPLFDATFKNLNDLVFEEGKSYNIFNYPCLFGQYLLLQYRNGDFVVPGYGFQDFNKVMNKYMNVVNGVEDGIKYVEVTLPYITYFTLNAHIENYTIIQQGAMRSCAPVYSSFNFKSVKAFAIVEGWVEDFYYDGFDFEKDGKDENVFYFNERNGTKTQEDFIKENFNCVEYSEKKSNFYGFYFNIPFKDLLFKEVEYPMASSGVSSYFISFNRVSSKVINSSICNVNKFIIYNFNGPYLSEFDNTAIITNTNSFVQIVDGSFNQLDDFLYNTETSPKILKQYMMVLSTELYKKSDDNGAGLSANWPYYDAYFLRITFTFDLDKIISKIKTGTYIVFYFPKLIKMGKVSKNYLTLPTLEYSQFPIEEDDYIFSFQQPGGASSDYNDTAITTTNVNNDYCVSINNNTLDGKLTVDNCEEWTRENNLFTITTSIPIINHCLIKGAFENEISNNSIQCIPEFFNQKLLCEIIYHTNSYYISGYIPPYLIKHGEGNSQYLEVLKQVYKEYPNEKVMDNFKEVYTINSSQDELTIYQKYTNWKQNDWAHGGEVFANVFCKSWKFRNIPCGCYQRVKQNNNISLPTIPLFKFDVIPEFPLNEYGEDYCPDYALNSCLFLANDTLDYKNVSELYESDNNTDAIRLESYIKHIPTETISNDLIYQLLGLYPGFGTIWKRSG